jgi:hypothetical protein
MRFCPRNRPKQVKGDKALAGRMLDTRPATLYRKRKRDNIGGIIWLRLVEPNAAGSG